MDFENSNIFELIDLVEQFFKLLISKAAHNGIISIKENDVLLFISKYEQKVTLTKHIIEEFEIWRKALLARKYAPKSERIWELLPGLPEDEVARLLRRVPSPSGNEEPGQDVGDDAASHGQDTVNGHQNARKPRRGSKAANDDGKANGDVPPGKRLSSQFSDLEVVEKVRPGVEKCPECGGKTTTAGYVVKERIVFVPGHFVVERDLLPKWRCMNCQAGGRVHVGDGDEPVIIKNSPVSSSLLQLLITQKFIYHLPCYRLEAMLASYGVNFRRNQLATWLIKTSRTLTPLYDLMPQKLRTNPLVNMDETHLQVHREEGRKNSAQSWLWLAIGRGRHPLAVFVYDPSRGADVIGTILGPDWSGSLQSDDYAGYGAYIKRSSGDIVRISCLAHVRRKFARYVKERNLKGKKLHPRDVHIVRCLALCDDIFKEHAAIARRSGLSPEEVVRLKHEKIESLLDRLETHLRGALDTFPAAARSVVPFAQDISYALNQLPGQRNYLNDPIAAPDNNICERAIKTVVIGRKNWMFADSPDGAKAIAIFFSLIISAVLNDISPEAYIHHLLMNITRADTTEKLEALLPYNVTLSHMNAMERLEFTPVGSEPRPLPA